MGVLEYPPSYARGVLYLTTDAGWATARDVFTGKLLWSRHFEPLVGEPALYRHRVYFGAYDQRVYALDQKNGHTVWSTPIGAKIESPPVIAERSCEPSEVSAKLPQALNLSTWPATFFVARSGLVQGAHAGFAGKATGAAHEQLKTELRATVEKLLDEKP